MLLATIGKSMNNIDIARLDSNRCYIFAHERITVIRKIELKYKDVKNFLQLLLNYLRISIIVMMLNNRKNDELIDLVDDSFIDEKNEEMLISIVPGAKDIIW